MIGETAFGHKWCHDGDPNMCHLETALTGRLKKFPFPATKCPRFSPIGLATFNHCLQ